MYWEDRFCLLQDLFCAKMIDFYYRNYPVQRKSFSTTGFIAYYENRFFYKILVCTKEIDFFTTGFILYLEKLFLLVQDSFCTKMIDLFTTGFIMYWENRFLLQASFCTKMIDFLTTGFCSVLRKTIFITGIILH